ncbi:hypothetical protein BJ508DRAFT_346330 [Ascobolus immersus RN42]|uniref:Uncharacterized protein n=1 Tax=Ascobolus immersus RN42 TaxID=1160509 RepID=A0A3N4HEK1_ASCIM|nr:hypothetical protein BJ508DRAFT_346330 [Ascobolus immersus RN42]
MSFRKQVSDMALATTTKPSSMMPHRKPQSDSQPESSCGSSSSSSTDPNARPETSAEGCSDLQLAIAPRVQQRGARHGSNTHSERRRLAIRAANSRNQNASVADDDSDIEEVPRPGYSNIPGAKYRPGKERRKYSNARPFAGRRPNTRASESGGPPGIARVETLSDSDFEGDSKAADGADQNEGPEESSSDVEASDCDSKPKPKWKEARDKCGGKGAVRSMIISRQEDGGRTFSLEYITRTSNMKLDAMRGEIRWMMEKNEKYLRKEVAKEKKNRDKDDDYQCFRRELAKLERGAVLADELYWMMKW